MLWARRRVPDTGSVSAEAELLQRLWLDAEHRASFASRALLAREWGVLGREAHEDAEFSALVHAYSVAAQEAEAAYRAWQDAEVGAVHPNATGNVHSMGSSERLRHHTN